MYEQLNIITTWLRLLPISRVKQYSILGPRQHTLLPKHTGDEPKATVAVVSPQSPNNAGRLPTEALTANLAEENAISRSE